jgi:hypothetical protein
LRSSSLLGILGGIFGLLIAAVEIILAAVIGQGILSVGSGISSSQISLVYGLGAVTMVGSVLGIAGGVTRARRGGVVMIFGGILTLIGASLLGALSFVLLTVGGVLALRQKSPEEEMSVPTSAPLQSAPPSSATASKFCTNCGTAISPTAPFCYNCGTKQL